jgi:hypothetical protein
MMGMMPRHRLVVHWATTTTLNRSYGGGAPNSTEALGIRGVYKRETLWFVLDFLCESVGKKKVSRRRPPSGLSVFLTPKTGKQTSQKKVRFSL